MLERKTTRTTVHATGHCNKKLHLVFQSLSIQLEERPAAHGAEVDASLSVRCDSVDVVVPDADGDVRTHEVYLRRLKVKTISEHS